jgi:hypothetical protein
MQKRNTGIERDKESANIIVSFRGCTLRYFIYIIRIRQIIIFGTVKYSWASK